MQLPRDGKDLGIVGSPGEMNMKTGPKKLELCFFFKYIGCFFGFMMIHIVFHILYCII